MEQPDLRIWERVSTDEPKEVVSWLKNGPGMMIHLANKTQI
jgi:hypothetical protein